MPVAIVATRLSGAYGLVHAAVVIPVAIGMGLGSLVLAGRSPQTQAAAVARLLGLVALALCCSASISLIVYGLLTSVGA